MATTKEEAGDVRRKWTDSELHTLIHTALELKNTGKQTDGGMFKSAHMKELSEALKEKNNSKWDIGQIRTKLSGVISSLLWHVKMLLYFDSLYLQIAQEDYSAF